MAVFSLGIEQKHPGPLLVIVGPTASGKTALAIGLAKQFNGEIICADSRTIYNGMDIGTAKPTVPERQGIPHHLLDVVSPDQPFTVADFQKRAYQAIADIHGRGKLPILVGGSGLYIDAVIYNYQFNADTKSRSQVNTRHAKEGSYQKDQTVRDNTLIIGLVVEQDLLRDHIAERVNDMVCHGLIDEVKDLSQKYGWDISAMQAPAYKSFRAYLAGELSLEEASALFVTADTQLAKKQRTWFKRNNSIQWVDDPSKAVDLTTTFLNKTS